MSRPLFVLFVTILVNLIGFGIIIPLLPFYAQEFGASPVTIGLLFASFSLAQLIAAPILGDLGYPRQVRGVAALPGLSFLGLLWQHSQASASLVGPRLDGPYLVDRMAGVVA